MKKSGLIPVFGVLVGMAVQAVAEEMAPVCPAAIFAFEERGAGVKDMGAKVSDILFAKMAVDPNLYLVDRQDMAKILEEQTLSLSGMVTPDQAVKVGNLTGAKILVTGSVIEADKTMYVVAKIIGTETSRVFGESVKGRTDDEIGPLVEQLAKQVGDSIVRNGDKLVAKSVTLEDRIAVVNKALGTAARPTVMVKVNERHVGQATSDPAVETELILFCKGTGFDVLDGKIAKGKADVMITGEGVSELALRHGKLVIVKVRLEIKAVDRATGKVIATDRQTSVVADLAEQIAAKNALQAAAAKLAERLLPQLGRK